MKEQMVRLTEYAEAHISGVEKSIDDWAHTMIGMETTTLLGDALRQSREYVAMVKRFLGVATTQRFTPEVMEPDALQKYLDQVRKKLSSYPKLKLPIPEEIGVWPYYNLMRVKPLLCPDFIVFVVEIPLESVDLHLNLYKVHNLPAINIKHGLAINYVIEGTYFAVSNDGNYVTVPDADAVRHCEVTGSTVCHFRSPLYPKESCKFCLCALYDDIMEDQTERINQNCPVQLTNSSKHRAIYLEDNYWAVTTSRDFQMQIVCRQRTSYLKIQAPLGFVNLTGGCMGISSELLLPPLQEVTTLADTETKENVMEQISNIIQSFERLKIWNYTRIPDQTVEAIRNFKLEVLPDLPDRLPMDLLNRKLQEIDIQPDSWYTDKFIWVLLALGLVAAVVGLLVYFVWCRGRATLLQRFLTRRKSNPLGEVVKAAIGADEDKEITQVEPSAKVAKKPSTAPPTVLDSTSPHGTLKRSRAGSIRSYTSLGYNLDPPPPEGFLQLQGLDDPLAYPSSLSRTDGRSTPGSIHTEPPLRTPGLPRRERIFESETVSSPSEGSPAFVRRPTVSANDSPLVTNLKKYATYVKSQLPDP